MRGQGYLWLAVAIVAEVVGTSALRALAGFTRIVPSVVVVGGYVVAFYCLSITLKTMPVGIVYAIWSGIGIVLITLVAMILYRQVPDLAAVAGLSLIIAGVVLLNVFSRMSAH
jgi:small multidrug resistance pump